MMPPTPSTAASSSRVAGADRVDRAEPLGERPRRDRPDVADVERDEEAPELLRLRDLEVREQLVRGRRQHVRRVAVELAASARRAGRLFFRCAGDCGGTARVTGVPSSSSSGQPGLGVAHDDLDREQLGDARSNSPASVASGGTSGTAGCVSAAADTSPSPSMSSAPREPMCSTRPRTCAGHERAFGQRRSMSPSFAGASGEPHSGQSAGMTNARSVPSRSSTTGPSTSGMTSPALRSTTVSPISTPFGLDDVLVVQRRLAHDASPRRAPAP